MRRLLLGIFCCVPLFALAQKGRVVDRSGGPVAGVAVTLLRPDSTYIGAVATDAGGRFSFRSDVRPYRLLFRHLAYRVRSLTSDREEVGVIVLEDAGVSIDSIVVRPEQVHQFANRKSYWLSASTIRKHTNFLHALDEIPTLSVDMNNKLSYMGGGSVKVLLNGVNSDEQELATLSPEEIARVEVYDTPPARFAAQGLSSVINVITKKHLTGGTVGLNLQDAARPWYGDNTLGMSYNRGNSRLSFQYGNTLRRIKHQRLSEELAYTFDNESFSKRKEGLDSPFDWDLNTFKAGYTYYKENDYQVSLTAGLDLQNRRERNEQLVTYSNGPQFRGLNTARNNYRKYLLDLYFSKTLRKNKEFLFGLTGTLFRTDFASGLRETDPDSGAEHFNSSNTVSGDKSSLIADMRYSCALKIGTLSWGLRDFVQYNAQRQTTVQNERLTALSNEAYGYGELAGKLREKFLYYASVGIEHAYFNSYDLGRSFSFLYFHPRVRLSYLLRKDMQLFAMYELKTTNPTISMLSETPVWLDNKYAFRGNAALQPGRTHSLLLGAYYYTRRFRAVLNLAYDNAPRAILPYFTQGDACVLQTYGNMRRAERYDGVAMVSWYPLKSEALMFKLTGSLTHDRVDGPGFSWSQNSARLFAEARLSLKKWEADLFYQTSSKIITGQLMRKLPRAAYVELYYKPLPAMSVGLGWRYPFFRGYEEGAQTHPSALVRSLVTSVTKDYANMIYLRFVYNFSFGRNPRSADRKLHNEDTDSGVLAK